MNLTHPFLDADGDKLREECGVFGVIGAKDAAGLTALGLHALQHRGQEAVGIVSVDGQEFFARKGLGHVAQVFSQDGVLAELPGTMASGHVRYSTTGGQGLRNVQPLHADLARGGFSIAHNGNISNAMRLKRELVSKGAIFQSTSDTEVIIHLIATSRFPKLLDRFVDALRMVEGAYSLICMTPKRMVACRDPLGIRPLVMGRIGDVTVFASETVALDVVGAEFVREIEPGEIVEVRHDGTFTSHHPFGRISPRPCIFEHVYFSRPDSVMGGKSVYDVRKQI
ncbi:MAG TPA: amidophosphoribosyltransferase, partial [Novosphingobium sp.]|nr:amidophosphoribosyltransferase [Novosphingobium sp.]